jgi:hypothetical protein
VRGRARLVRLEQPRLHRLGEPYALAGEVRISRQLRDLLAHLALRAARLLERAARERGEAAKGSGSDQARRLVRGRGKGYGYGYGYG